MAGKLRISDKIILFPLWLITLLPLRILYFFSDFLYVILYHVIRYRKGVVFDNLHKAFPEKKKKEIIVIARRFYRYLCDYFIESIYLINMNSKECNRRYRYTNPDLLQKFYDEGRSIILAVGHQGNWEWANNLTICSPYTIYGIYKPLSNKLFDRLFIHVRGKFRSMPVPMKQTFRTVKTLLMQKKLFALYLVGDQRPPKGDLEFWTTFLNQETPVITGMDKLARKFNFPVLFMNVFRIRRGYYEVTFTQISHESSKLPPYKIAEEYMKCVERLIHSQPEFWLWSHKRFKYRPEEYKTNTVS